MGRFARVSTEGLGAHECAAAWTDYVSTYVGCVPDDAERSAIDFHPHAGPAFRGLLEYGDLGPLRLCRMICGANRYQRSTSDDPHRADTAMLILQNRGHSEFIQANTQTRLTPGYWTTIDTSRPFSITSSVESEHLILLVRADVELKGMLAESSSRRLGATGSAKLLQQLILGAFQECERLSARGADASAASISSLLRVALEECASSPAAPASAWQKARITDYIHRHLGVL